MISCFLWKIAFKIVKHQKQIDQMCLNQKLRHFCQGYLKSRFACLNDFSQSFSTSFKWFSKTAVYSFLYHRNNDRDWAGWSQLLCDFSCWSAEISLGHKQVSRFFQNFLLCIFVVSMDHFSTCFWLFFSFNTPSSIINILSHLSISRVSWVTMIVALFLSFWFFCQDIDYFSCLFWIQTSSWFIC